MSEREGKFVHSYDNIYNSEQFGTRKKAIEDGLKEYDNEPFNVGQIYEVGLRM